MKELAEGNFTVLLLEAGGFPDRYDLPYDAPALIGKLVGESEILLYLVIALTPDTPVDWTFTSEAVPGLYNRSVAQHRGFCLGGTSSINGSTYRRGSRSIFDNWRDVGNPGWGWDDIQDYFRKASRFLTKVCITVSADSIQTWQLVPLNDADNYAIYDTSPYSSTGGSGRLDYTSYNPPSIDAFVESMPAIGVPIASDLNYSSANPIINLPVSVTQRHEIGLTL